jgi:soluble lytic murein transglycosylase-like protein
MKYLGVAYACVIAVVAAAAIYLVEAPGAVRSSAPSGVEVAATPPDAPRLSALPESSVAVSPADKSMTAANAAAMTDITSVVPSVSTLSATPRELSQDEPPLLHKEQTAAIAQEKEQTRSEGNSRQGNQAAPERMTITSAHDAVPSNHTVEIAATSERASAGLAISDALSEPEPLLVQPAIDAPKTEQAKLGEDVPESTPPSANSPTEAADAAPAQNEALLPHETSTADDAAKPEQARLEENSSESAEQAAPFQTASAGDFDYIVPPNAVGGAALSNTIAPIVVPGPVSRHEPLTDEQKAEQAKLEQDNTSPAGDVSSDSFPPKRSYLAYYVYAEHPPERKPADLALDALKNVPIGTPLQEIKRAAAAFGLDYNFMKAVAKVESDFNPRQRTGSYIGLFQLSHYEFAKYGSGDILNPRDNAIAAAYKFINEGTQFEWDTHKNPTYSDLYLIHQQGWQGAAEHVSHPEWVAWKSMCATDEGKEKGEKWCKRAIWQNTLPAIKQMWKSVENLPSSAFVTMWRQRINRLYARYSDMIGAKQDVDVSAQQSEPHESACAKAGGCAVAGKKVADIGRQQPKPLESTCAKPGSCHSQPPAKSVSNKSLRQRVSHARRRLVPGGNARNVHAFVGVGVHHS